MFQRMTTGTSHGTEDVQGCGEGKKEIAVLVYGSHESGMDHGTDIHEAVHALGKKNHFILFLKIVLVP